MGFANDHVALGRKLAFPTKRRGASCYFSNDVERRDTYTKPTTLRPIQNAANNTTTSSAARG